MMKLSILLICAVCVLQMATAQVKFGQLCSGNPANTKRGHDNYGDGKYGASRGTRTHVGLDIECADGATVYAPFDVTLKRKSVPYEDDKPINDGIELSGEGLCFKLFYVKPDKYSGSIKKGQRIGTMLPMQKVYQGITSHVHVQMCDKSDPTRYF